MHRDRRGDVDSRVKEGLMLQGSPGFDNNEGMGGFERGGYDQEAMHPTEANWTRQSRFRIPDEPQPLWQVATGGAYIDATVVQGAFAVDRNSNILVSDCDDNLGGPHYGRLFRISPSGEKSEIFRTGLWLKSPVIGKDGLIYLATTGATVVIGGKWTDSTDHKLYCLFPDGRVNWEFPIGSNACCKPVLDGSGNVYVFSHGNKVGTLFSIRADGALNWQHEFRSPTWCEPLVSQDGVIYVGLSVDRKLYAFDKSGRELWARRLGQGPGSDPPNIASDGTIYVCLSATLFALHADGTTKWQYRPKEQSVMHGPAIDREGNLYLNLNALKLVSLSPEGKERWRTTIAGFATAPPVIGRCDRLCQQSYMDHSPQHQSWVEAYSLDGQKAWAYELDGIIVSTVLARDNRIYALSNCKDHIEEPPLNRWNRRWELHAIGQ